MSNWCGVTFSEDVPECNAAAMTGPEIEIYKLGPLVIPFTPAAPFPPQAVEYSVVWMGLNTS